MTQARALLHATNLSVAFGGLIAVDDVNFRVNRGEILSLIGPNGAGKTSCLNLLTGFTKPTEGSIQFLGREISGLPPWSIARQGLLRTFQHNSLLFNLTVFENILTGLHVCQTSGLWASMIGTRRFRNEERVARDTVSEILKILGMEAQRDAVAKTLPFGGQRKLGIGIALAAHPKLLLLDEPAAGMNPDESLQLMELMRKLNRSGTTIVLVEHDMRVVMGISDRIVVLNRGKIIAEGSPDLIAANEQVIQVYLGGGGVTRAGA